MISKNVYYCCDVNFRLNLIYKSSQCIVAMKFLHYTFIFIFSIIIIFIHRLLIYFTADNNLDCPPEHFHLPTMKECHPWLKCDDLEDITVKELIGVGAVKAVYRAVWSTMNITYCILNNPNLIDDFNSGLEMLRLLNPSPYVTQLIGFCPSQNVIWTEYHPLGNAVNIVDKIRKTGSHDNVHVRLKLCLNYALLLEYLHSGPAGCRVMCDSNTLEKTLSQLLVTNELSLLLNDVDALPEINSEQKTIRCGNKNLSGNFIAPEQRASGPHELKGYNEKTDIWKAASVCDYFISDVSNSEMIRYKLFFLHKKCKSLDINERPTATQLAAQYIKIMYELEDEL